MSGGDGEGFLGRWSRLKRHTDGAETAEPAPAVDATPQETPAVATQDGPVARRQADDALPELPSLDSITATTDMRVFMHPAVPAAIRNAALRRVWSLDPAIRDFVSPALDYAYDWNTPGGAPGYGPLVASDDVASLLRDAIDGFARPIPVAEAEPAVEDPPAPGQVAAAEPLSVAPPAERAPSPEAPSPEPPSDPLRLGPVSASPTLPPPFEAAAEHLPVAPAREPAAAHAARRRHGGALPS